jgi:hypothetical protein
MAPKWAWPFRRTGAKIKQAKRALKLTTDALSNAGTMANLIAIAAGSNNCPAITLQISPRPAVFEREKMINVTIGQISNAAIAVRLWWSSGCNVYSSWAYFLDQDAMCRLSPGQRWPSAFGLCWELLYSVACSTQAPLFLYRHQL